jgi:hypothetical protein
MTLFGFLFFHQKASGADGTLSRLGLSYYPVKIITWRA